MLSRILDILLVVMVIGLVGYFIYKMPKYKSGEVAPLFESVDQSGNAFRLEDLKGNYVLIDFWGSWCGPCRRDNVKLVDLYNKYEGKQFTDANGLEIVSVGIEKDKSSWLAAIQKDGLYWRYHIPQMERFKSPVAKMYGIKEIPTKYFLDPNLNIISVNEDVEDIDTFLSNKLKN